MGVRILGLFFLLLFFSNSGFSQTPKVDSLMTLINSSRGVEQLTHKNQLAEAFLENNASKTLELTEEVLATNAIDQASALTAKSRYLKARALTILGDYELAYPLFDTAQKTFDDLEDKSGIALCHLGRGMAFTYQSKYEEASQEFDQSLNIYTDLDDTSGQAWVLHEIGHLKYQTRDLQESLNFYNKSIALNEALGNRKGLSDNYFRIGISYLSKNDDEKALDYFTKSRSIKEEIGDATGLARVNISLGIMHEEMGNFKTALDYYQESLEANKTFGDVRINSVLFNNIGIAYDDWGKLDSALVNHRRSLELRKSINDERGVVQSLVNIGDVYKKQEKTDQSLFYYRQAFNTSQSSSQKPMLSFLHQKIGQAHLASNRLDSAATYFNKELELRMEEGDYFRMGQTYGNLAALYEKRGDYKKSLEYFKLHKEVQDSLSTTRSNKELAEVQAKYDTEKQEKEIIGLQQENEKRTLWRNIFAIGTVAALGFALLLFQFFMYRNKKNKELLAAEESQREQLQQLDKMKSRFFSNISHEFRTPLTLILGPLDKIRKNVDESLQPTVNIIERNGNRLLKLINQLLDLSKIESGKVSLKAALVDVMPLIKGWVMSFHSIAESKHIKLKIDSKQESHFVYVDSEKLEEVIINLLSNAFKYTSKGGKIKISLDEHKPKNQLRISVSDTGTGIPEQELEHIFDRFYQASNADTEDVTGTGIGLSLIKELVELHKGEVKVDSKVGKGTTFEIALPLGKAHLAEDEIVNINTTKEKSVEQGASQHEKKEPEEQQVKSESDLPLVLMIEDNEDLRMYIKDILQPHYQVLQAVDGKEGLAMAQEHIPDLVLSDLMMPKMDGLEVCKRLKEEMLTNHIPVILLTAKAAREDKLEGLKSLADDYFTKPFNTEELLIRLQNLISIRKTLQAKFESADVLMPKKLQLSSLDSIFMEKVTEQMETEISNSLFGVVELAYAVGLSRSQLFRKMKAITNLTPNEYIRSFRLHRAMDMLQQQTGSVSEVAYATGFQNPSYFSKVFQEQFKMAPSSVTK